MIKLGKEKGYERIADWVKGARNHLYWCATSTKQGFGEMIVTKWKSFMEHVANKHDNHPNSLFKKCAHGDNENRRWIRIGILTKNYIYFFRSIGEVGISASCGNFTELGLTR